MINNIRIYNRCQNKKSKVNLNLMKQKDWWWVAPEGLVDKDLNCIDRKDHRAKRLLVKGSKSLVLIYHNNNNCDLKKSVTKNI